MIVCLGKSADVKTGDLPGEDARRCARQESEPPYELRSGVTPVERRAAGKRMGGDHEPRKDTSASPGSTG